MTQTTLTTPFGSYTLSLCADDRSGSLRAWDAADEYILDELTAREPEADSEIGVFNDAFGALSVSLHRYRHTIFTDSFTSREAIMRNRRANGLAGKPEFGSLPEAANHSFSHILIKIPKTLSLLEHQLRKVRTVLRPGSVILGAGMTRTVHSSTLKLFEEILGPVTTSLARKKARLIFAGFNPGLQPPPGDVEHECRVKGIPEPLVNYPGVFSRDHLDMGSRFFLEHMTIPEAPVRIADFGCGNGVLGIAALLKNPRARAVAVDDSAMAVESARRNFLRNGLQSRAAVLHGSSLSAADGEFDIVISNPPFHQGRRNSIDVALAMFADAFNCLSPGGELQIVANGHLGYHTHINRIFGNVSVEASNRKFVVLRAEKGGKGWTR